MSVNSPEIIRTAQGGSGQYGGNLRPVVDGVVLTAGIDDLIETATLTLINEADGEVINDWDAVDLLAHDEFSVADDGAFTWNVLAADNPIVDSTIRGRETHLAIFEVVFTGGQGLAWAVKILVLNLRRPG